MRKDEEEGVWEKRRQDKRRQKKVNERVHQMESKSMVDMKALKSVVMSNENQLNALSNKLMLSDYGRK